jgi:hypothetical protein
MTTAEPPTAVAAVPLDADLLCGGCSHNLRGVTSDRCPECGRRFDRSRIITDAIPWEQRRQLGRFRSYWRTVRYVSFRFNKAAGAQMSLSAARSFRRWTVVLVVATLLTPILWNVSQLRWPGNAGSFRSFFRGEGDVDWEDAITNRWFFASALVSLLLWLIAATGVAAWFVYSKRLARSEQSRAVAGTLYACAPLAWMTPMAILAGILIGLANTYYWGDTPLYYVGSAVVVTLLLLIALTPLAWLIVTALHVGRVTSARRGIAAVVLLPLLWAALAAVILFSVTFVVNYVFLLIYAQR